MCVHISLHKKIINWYFSHWTEISYFKYTSQFLINLGTFVLELKKFSPSGDNNFDFTKVPLRFYIYLNEAT